MILDLLSIIFFIISSLRETGLMEPKGYNNAELLSKLNQVKDYADFCFDCEVATFNKPKDNQASKS